MLCNVVNDKDSICYGLLLSHLLLPYFTQSSHTLYTVMGHDFVKKNRPPNSYEINLKLYSKNKILYKLEKPSLPRGYLTTFHGCNDYDENWYLFIYLFLTAIRLTQDSSSIVCIYTRTICRKTQLTVLVGRLSGIRTQRVQTNWKVCGPCPNFASYTLAFALQLRKKQGKTSVRVAEECQLARWKQNIQNRRYIKIRIHKHNNKNT